MYPKTISFSPLHPPAFLRYLTRPPILSKSIRPTLTYCQLRVTRSGKKFISPTQNKKWGKLLSASLSNRRMIFMNASLTSRLQAAMNTALMWRVVRIILWWRAASTLHLIALYFELCSLTNFTLAINKALYSFIIEFLFSIDIFI